MHPEGRGSSGSLITWARPEEPGKPGGRGAGGEEARAGQDAGGGPRGSPHSRYGAAPRPRVARQSCEERLLSGRAGPAGRAGRALTCPRRAGLGLRCGIRAGRGRCARRPASAQVPAQPRTAAAATVRPVAPARQRPPPARPGGLCAGPPGVQPPRARLRGCRPQAPGEEVGAQGLGGGGGQWWADCGDSCLLPLADPGT